MKTFGIIAILILLSGLVQAPETGFELWSYMTGGKVYDVSVSSDGSYIAVPSCYVLYLFNREGKEFWNYNADDCWRCS